MKLFNEALNYSTRTAFEKGSSGAYRAARKNGWLDAVCFHMMDNPTKGAPTKWTFDIVQQEASLYQSRTAFMKGSTGAYSAALRNGWLDQACSHMSRPSVNKKWTFEIVHQQASLYSTRNAFLKGSNNAYNAARNNGWLDEVCSHMVAAPRPGAPTKWTFDVVHREALNYQTRSAFQKALRMLIKQP